MSEITIGHERATGQIRFAIKRLSSHYPFHVNVLERFRLVCRPGMGTMGVAKSKNSIVLLFDPQFVLTIQVTELCGVLLHEVNHVVFGHILQRSDDYPDQWALTVAQEVTSNEYVFAPLPGNPIVLAQFPDLPPGESTVQRYQRLCRVGQRDGVDTSLRTSSAAKSADIPHVVDDHYSWLPTSEDGEGSMETVRQLLAEAYYDNSPTETPDHVRDALECLGIGTTPGGKVEQLNNTRNGTIDWQQQLRRYVGRALVSQASFSRPNRRLPHLVGIVPGTARRAARPCVIAVVDTSASMSTGLLEQVNAELKRLSRHYQVTLVQCDTQIHSVEKFTDLRQVKGRGGTDLRPPFALKFLRKHHPDLMIYFTDGHGPSPQKQPDIPVIWCVVPGGTAPVSWGKVIRCGRIDNKR